jgi:predicted Zn-dependent protease
MAGGKVGVFSGLFDLVSNDDQLASVVAHEVAHVTAKHVNEKFSQQSILAGGGTVLGSAASGLGALTQSTILSIYGMGTGVGALGFDRKKEMEADYVGLIYMARAGYDPREARVFMEKMDAATAGRSAPPKWLSTHPTHPERLLQMIDKMPEALEVYERNRRPVK